MLIFGQNSSKNATAYENDALLTTFGGAHTKQDDTREMTLLTLTVPYNDVRTNIRPWNTYVFVTGMRRQLSVKTNATQSLSGTRHVHTFGTEIGTLSIDVEIPAIPADVFSSTLIRDSAFGSLMTGEAFIYKLFNDAALNELLSNNKNLTNTMITLTHDQSIFTKYTTDNITDNYLKGWLTSMSVNRTDAEHGIITSTLNILPFRS